jgi:uncharacterized protein (TIGR02145 family)
LYVLKITALKPILLWPMLLWCHSLGLNQAAHRIEAMYAVEPDGVLEYTSSLSDSIGSNNWDYRNLNADKFGNGEAIPEARTAEQWKKAGEQKKPAWCYYENDPAYGRVYGKLYNWYAVTDPRGLAPAGWHILGDPEWTVLAKNSAGPGGDSIVTKQTGFARIPGGYRLNSGVFSNMGRVGYWWTSSDHDGDLAWYRYLHDGYGAVGRGASLKDCGFSVRCLKD